jgi:phospholipid/cholesterol/gamma-HCH transport system ATP-binding protein
MHLLRISGKCNMSEHSGPAVVFDQVFKAFGPHQVLREVSFQVPAGQALCILGRSGTGKSVTLKLLIALLKPDRGSIWVDGDDISRLKPSGLSKVRRKMGFLFQDAALFDSLTLYENLALPLARLTTKSPAEIDFAVNDVLRQVELEGDQGKLPSDLSGGMRKRAGLARALVLEPKVLLADEPSSGLDRITASEIDELLLRQKREKGVTILVVTHDVHGARRVGDRFAVLDKGDLIAYGTAAEVENSGRDTARKLITEDYPA